MNILSFQANRRIMGWKILALSIHEYLDFGTTQWCFSHVAVMDRDGTVNMNQLADDECVVSPGLVYRKK